MADRTSTSSSQLRMHRSRQRREQSARIALRTLLGDDASDVKDDNRCSTGSGSCERRHAKTRASRAIVGWVPSVGLHRVVSINGQLHLKLPQKAWDNGRDARITGFWSRLRDLIARAWLHASRPRSRVFRLFTRPAEFRWRAHGPGRAVHLDRDLPS